MKQNSTKVAAAKAKTRKPSAAVQTGPTGENSPPAPASVPITVVSLDSLAPHLLLRASGVLDEGSLAGFFKSASEQIAASGAKRVLVDLRECELTLSISDMNGLAKMVASSFSGSLERMAVVLRPRDILTEKFFEPALTSRGLPTLVASDYDDAVYWLGAKLPSGR
jgi:hypothetical protein